MKIPIVICALFFAACSTPEQKNETITTKEEGPLKLFSSQVKDTFYISVQVPKLIPAGRTLPVIYLVDANFYFDVMASTFKKYSEVGLLPEAILVGVGYKNFVTMDSLRNRDLTYPVAIPEYEMSKSGGADKFLSFIESDVVPYIDSHYPCDKNRRVLMGHSLGGYFTLYALQQHLSQNKNTFHSYIAASPSMDYNHNYILKEFEKISTSKISNKRVYVSFGSLEDEQTPDDTAALKCPVVLNELTRLLKDKNKLIYKGDMYSNLDHMDTGFPTFVKGIQLSFTEEQ